MGCYLSAANTDKDTHHEDSPFLPYAVCNMQGWRRNQEDARSASAIDECVAVLANGEEPDEEMLAKCQDIAREEFANQATLEDENSY